MLDIVRSLLGALRATVRTHRALALENLALRHQLTVLQRRTQGRTRLTPADRLLWVWLARSWREWRQGLILVKPETVVRWSHQRFRTYWARKSRRRSGRPAIDPDIRALIRQISRANPLWGTPRIDSELRKLGIKVSPTTVAKYRVGQRHPPSPTWRSFLRNHARDLVAADFFTVPDGHVPGAVRVRHPGAPPTPHRPPERYRKPHCRVGRTAGRRSLPRGYGAALSPPGPRPHLRTSVPASGGRPGDPRGTHRCPLTLAESVRRACDRLDPPGVPRPRHRAQRAAPAPGPSDVPRVLPSHPVPPRPRPGRAGWPRRPRAGAGYGHRHPGGRRTPSSLRTAGGMIADGFLVGTSSRDGMPPPSRLALAGAGELSPQAGRACISGATIAEGCRALVTSQSARTPHRLPTRSGTTCSPPNPGPTQSGRVSASIRTIPMKGYAATRQGRSGSLAGSRSYQKTPMP